MDDLERLQTALINADKAGDTAAATTLAQEIRRRQSAPDMFTSTAKSDSNLENLGAAVGGALYAPYLGVKQMLGMASPQDVDEYKRSMAGLWSTPMGKVGTLAGGLAAGAPLSLIPGANTLAGAALAGAAYGAAQPVADGDSRLANAGFGAAGGVAGKYIGEWLGKLATSASANKAADLAAQQTRNAARDATVREMQAEGMVIPPSSVNPSAVNRVAEGFSGKIMTQQAAAVKNQGIVTDIAKRELGIPDAQQLTDSAISAVRNNAGKLYDAVRQVGTVPVDTQFASDVGQAIGPYAQLAGQFPSQRNPAIDALVKDLSQPTMESGAIVDLVKRLRFDGFRNVKAQDPQTAALGQVQIAAQNALEDMLDRHLSQIGQPDLLNGFRQARTLIAKSYTVQNALEDSTGKVVASKIGREFSKGRPLTGGLATIGKAAEAFPKAVQNVNTSMPGLSPLDFMGGVLAGGAIGPAGAAGAFARPVVRAGLLSGAYQRAMASPPSYQLGLLDRFGPTIANSESAQALLRALGMSLPTIQQ